MTTYEVTFEIDLPSGITDDQIDEWLKYKLGLNCELLLKNPL